jgi:hypothetical protein
MACMVLASSRAPNTLMVRRAASSSACSDRSTTPLALAPRPLHICRSFRKAVATFTGLNSAACASIKAHRSLANCYLLVDLNVALRGSLHLSSVVVPPVPTCVSPSPSFPPLGTCAGAACSGWRACPSHSCFPMSQFCCCLSPSVRRFRRANGAVPIRWSARAWIRAVIHADTGCDTVQAAHGLSRRQENPGLPGPCRLFPRFARTLSIFPPDKWPGGTWRTRRCPRCPAAPAPRHTAAANLSLQA